MHGDCRASQNWRFELGFVGPLWQGKDGGRIMNDKPEEIEKELAKLRAEVVRLKRTVVTVLIVSVATLGLLCIPGVGFVVLGLILLAIPLALFIFVFGTAGAYLGAFTGRVIRCFRREPRSRLSI